MFERLTSACSKAITPFFIQYAKYIPEIVDGLNIVCGGINYALQRFQVPVTLNKIIEFTQTEKELLSNQFKLTTQLNNPSSPESALLLKSTRMSIWLGGILVGYLGLGQQLLCNLALITTGFLSSDSAPINAADMAFYWFSLLVTVIAENTSITSAFIYLVPFYAVLKFCLFYSILKYEILRTYMKKSTYDYLVNIKPDADVEAILRKAKLIVSDQKPSGVGFGANHQKRA